MMGEIHRIMLGDVCGLHALGMFVADLFKSRWQLEAENLFLRHQLTIAMPYREPKTVDEDLRIG